MGFDRSYRIALHHFTEDRRLETSFSCPWSDDWDQMCKAGGISGLMRLALYTSCLCVGAMSSALFSFCSIQV